MSHSEILVVTPAGAIIRAALLDEYRAVSARPVSLPSLPAIIGHSRPLSAQPVVLQ